MLHKDYNLRIRTDFRKEAYGIVKLVILRLVNVFRCWLVAVVSACVVPVERSEVGCEPVSQSYETQRDSVHASTERQRGWRPASSILLSSHLSL